MKSFKAKTAYNEMDFRYLFQTHPAWDWEASDGEVGGGGGGGCSVGYGIVSEAQGFGATQLGYLVFPSRQSLHILSTTLMNLLVLGTWKYSMLLIPFSSSLAWR